MLKTLFFLDLWSTTRENKRLVKEISKSQSSGRAHSEENCKSKNEEDEKRANARRPDAVIRLIKEEFPDEKLDITYTKADRIIAYWEDHIIHEQKNVRFFNKNKFKKKFNVQEERNFLLSRIVNIINEDSDANFGNDKIRHILFSSISEINQKLDEEYFQQYGVRVFHDISHVKKNIDNKDELRKASNLKRLGQPFVPTEDYDKLCERLGSEAALNFWSEKPSSKYEESERKLFSKFAQIMESSKRLSRL